MAEKGSVYQKGGGGTNFEQAVQSAYLAMLLINGSAPINISNKIVEIAFQTTNRGFNTDDLLVITESNQGTHQLLFQIKTQLSFTVNNSIFIDVINDFWKDYNSEKFNKKNDYLILVLNGLTNDERNHIKVILNWAKTHAYADDFISEVERIAIKKEKLNIFREVLIKANDDNQITDEDLWQFLKCFEVFDYDFGNQNSLDESYIKNLISVSKNKTNPITETEIWSNILSVVSKLNKDGGSVTTKSVRDEEVFFYFDTAKIVPYYDCLERFRQDGLLTLEPIKNKIGDFHLTRLEILENLIQKVQNNSITIVTGNAGVGKSALVKELLTKENILSEAFIFKADQFNISNLSELFSKIGNNISVEGIFSIIALSKSKIIFIDSLERLLEADPDCSFKQLVSLQEKYNDIKIVATSRTYSVDLIVQKFGINKDKLGYISVPYLDKNELEQIQKNYPILSPLIKNNQIKSLIQVPKYLDFSLKALETNSGDLDNVSIIELKKILWNQLVINVHNKTSGMPIKRDKAFISIAVNRAKEMRLFTIPKSDIDEEAVLELEKDNIIFQDVNDMAYSPSHDILEDWALVKYVARCYDASSTTKEFFNQIGNEPAIRRAFRLWIEENLIEDFSKLNELILNIISDNSFESYWADEALIAVLKSSNSNNFFIFFKDYLLETKTRLLTRIMHLLKTACREYIFLTDGSSILNPIGSGWKETIFFISQNIIDLIDIRTSILHFITNWNDKIWYNQKEISFDELNSVKRVVLYFLEQVKNKDDFWHKEVAIFDKTEDLIIILFQLAKISKLEIHDLIYESLSIDRYERDYKLNGFYKKVINIALNDRGAIILSKYLPELLIDTMWKEWKLELEKKKAKIVKESDISFPLSQLLENNDELEGDKCWGIKDKSAFFPSGVFRTPIYYLLKYNTEEGISFIIEFLNYSSKFYLESKCRHKNELKEIELTLSNGKKIKQIGSPEMWIAFRGMSVTHYGIECILMSTEYYLMELAKLKTETSRKHIQAIFNSIITKSNNVFAMGVLASITMAYPEEIGDKFLPLLTVKEFYSWDSNRALNEQTNTHSEQLLYSEFENRIAFGKLEHRTKYFRGLEDFVIEYQYRIETFNENIQNIIAKMISECKESDVLWQKKLDEMDFKNWKKEKHEEYNGYMLMPSYSDSVIKFQEANKEVENSQNNTYKYSNIITNAYNEPSSITIEVWNECYNYFLNKAYFDRLFDKPVHLAVIGLNEFRYLLNSEQINWCKTKIQNTIVSIIKINLSHSFNIELEYNIVEKNLALESFHLLFEMDLDNQEKLSELIVLYLYMLSAHFSDNEKNQIYKYTRDCVSLKYPMIHNRIWYGFLNFSKFKKEFISRHKYYDRQHVQGLAEEEYDFLKKQSEIILPSKISFGEINLKDFIMENLIITILITPFNTENNNFTDYKKEIFEYIFSILNKEDYQYLRQSNELDYRCLLDFCIYLRDTFIHNKDNLYRELFIGTLKQIYNDEKDNYKKYKFKFIEDLLKYFILQIDALVANTEDIVLKNYYTNRFWQLWGIFYNQAKVSNSKLLINYLLLGIDWKHESKNWIVLEAKRDFYKNMMNDFKTIALPSIIKVLSTIGDKSLLPEGIKIIVEAIKIDNNLKFILTYESSERLIKRLFLNHISKIKSNKKLIEDYIFILNNMIDLGSSEAYFYRENVIIYKNMELS
ncbi:ATP-binding protein [Chryseobacterium geocarposphaerae]|uniref:ATPase family protein associated with various cellular activities (AAA) n=1 Tax=Chryseobacterium geocarposphaerae TaxID=1416776 RepID=A0A2M9CBB3_9FLAO|nr:ATP-binding protein [Chryseobacterium geocarposphaerae]PJJ68143.1 hypothetical protein CLV73_2178 [Chryseobacterium geocarposphaerae]